MTERIAILGGTGSLGYGLALRLGTAGFQVVIGSRAAERAKEAAARATDAMPGAAFVGAENSEAASAASTLVIIAVPFANQSATIRTVTNSLREGQIILDATVPLGPAVGGRPTHMLGVWQGSAGEQARALLPPSVGVVSGLHTLSASSLEDLSTPIGQDTLICSDVKKDKDAVRSILEQIEGLRVVDAGKLEASRLVEGLTPLLIGINIRYKTHAGIRITGLD